MSDIPIDDTGFDRCISWLTNWLMPKLPGSNERYVLNKDMDVAAIELAELRADLQAAQERITQLEAALAFGDAEQARQLEAARKAFCDYESPQDTIAFAMRELVCIIPADEMLWHTWLLRQADVIDAWIAANPAPAQEPQS